MSDRKQEDLGSNHGARNFFLCKFQYLRHRRFLVEKCNLSKAIGYTEISGNVTEQSRRPMVSKECLHNEFTETLVLNFFGYL